MRSLLTRAAIFVTLGLIGSIALALAPAAAGTKCAHVNPATGQCVVYLQAPAHPGNTGTAGDDGPKDTGSGAACYWDPAKGGGAGSSAQPVPCQSKHGYWSNTENCYVQPLNPQPPPSPGDSRPGTSYNCYDPQTGASFHFWQATPPPGAAVGPTPREVAQMAIKKMNLSAIDIGIAPEQGPDSIGLVGMPVWMWAKAPNEHTVGPITESASAGGITITAMAKVLHITWDMGDGTEVVCDTEGTPYKPEFGRKDSPDCGHTYKLSSVRETDDAYTVTATSSWVITWAGAGQTGTIRLDGLNRSTQIRIGEAQVLVN
jgi:hypothetical protein